MSNEVDVVLVNGFEIGPVPNTGEIVLRLQIQSQPNVFIWTHRYCLPRQAALDLRKDLDAHLQGIQPAPRPDQDPLH